MASQLTTDDVLLYFETLQRAYGPVPLWIVYEGPEGTTMVPCADMQLNTIAGLHPAMLLLGAGVGLGPLTIDLDADTLAHPLVPTADKQAATDAAVARGDLQEGFLTCNEEWNDYELTQHGDLAKEILSFDLDPNEEDA